MKTFIVALMMISGSTNAFERSAVDSFLSILPIGQYHGEDCSVKVIEVNFPDKAIVITGRNANHIVSKVVTEGSDFLLRAHRKEFIQTNRYYVDASKASYIERIVRTFIAGKNQLYVVTAVETSIKGKHMADKVECVINLK